LKGGENMTEKITVSVLLDQETLDELRRLQSKYEVFSRSALLREVIEKGLKSVENSLAKK
jgi:metal-responsive CopG/Arc/MetJ family transcriptional regulator